MKIPDPFHDDDGEPVFVSKEMASIDVNGVTFTVHEWRYDDGGFLHMTVDITTENDTEISFVIDTAADARRLRTLFGLIAGAIAKDYIGA